MTRARAMAFARRLSRKAAAAEIRVFRQSNGGYDVTNGRVREDRGQRLYATLVAGERVP